jgi:uncharacterized membrane protein YfcA
MNWIVFAFVGSVAQLVDGSMGMGFGLTSTTLLLSLGATAALSSTMVHLAEIGTTLASGTSHWRVGNVDKDVLKKLAIPGGIGAFAGATFLSFIDLSVAKIFISTLLLLLGGLLLYRSVVELPSQIAITEVKSPRFLSYLGLTGGFVDASGGGGGTCTNHHPALATKTTLTTEPTSRETPNHLTRANKLAVIF